MCVLHALVRVGMCKCVLYVLLGAGVYVCVHMYVLYALVSVAVCMYVCVFAGAFAHVWRPEVDIKCLPLLLILRQGRSLTLKLFSLAWLAGL